MSLATGFVLIPGLALGQETGGGDTAVAADSASVASPTPEQLAELLPPMLDDGAERKSLDSGIQQEEPGAQATYEDALGSFRVTLGGIGSMSDRLLPMLETQASRSEEVQKTSYGEHPAYQGTMQGRTQVMVVLNEQIAVRVATEGEHTTDQLRAALDALDFQRLEELAGFTPEEAGG